MRQLDENSLRVLRRIADDMRSGFTGRVELDLKDGGVAGFREIRSVHPSQMREADEETVRWAC